MKNLSRLTALLIAFVMLFHSTAFAAGGQISMDALDMDSYTQLLSSAGDEESGTALLAGVINSDGAKMYQKPYNSLAFGNVLLATLGKGEAVAVYEGTFGSTYAGWWYKVEYGGQTGYIQTDYIDFAEEETPEDEIRDEATGITAQGVDAGAALVVQTLGTEMNLGAEFCMIADISIDGNWSGSTVTLTMPVDTDESTLDVLHFIEDEQAISADSQVMDASAFAALGSALDKAIAACYAATGLEGCVAVELHRNLPVEDGCITFDVSSFSVFAAGDVAATTYEFYLDGELHGRQVLIGDENGKATLLQPQTPSKGNFEFLGWKVQGDEDTELITFGEIEVSKTEDATIKCDAVFGDETYNVYFMYRTSVQDENAYIMRTVTGRKGDVIDVTAVHYPSSDQLIVQSWHTDKEPTEENKVESVTLTDSDITLWPNVAEGFWITFDTLGGTPVNPIPCASGSVATKPADPTRAGYTFGGWAIMKDGAATESTFDFTTAITQSLELQAIWKTAETSYTVVPMMENADGTYSPIAGASWTEKGTTGDTVTYKTVKDELAEHIANAEEGSEFVVDRKWFAAAPEEEATEEDATEGVMLAGDGSSVLRIHYPRRTIQYQFYDKDTNNGSSATSGDRKWVDDEEGNPLRYTMTGRYGETMTYKHVKSYTYDGDEPTVTPITEDEYNNTFKSKSWMYLGTTGNGANWEFNINEFTTLPSQYETIDNDSEPYYSYKIFEGTSKVAPDGQTWQLFYYGQALNAEGTTVANPGVDVTNMDDITFTGNDDPTGEKPAASMEADKNWTRLATETWKDEANAEASVVWYVPKEGFTLAAYALDILPNGVTVTDPPAESRLDATNAKVEDVGNNEDNENNENDKKYKALTYIWEVAVKNSDSDADSDSDSDAETTKYFWTALHYKNSGDTDTHFYGSYLGLGQWKHWFAEDKNTLFKDGDAVLSYMRNRGDIYIRMLRNRYQLTMVNPYYTAEGGSNTVGSTSIYYQAVLNPQKQAEIQTLVDLSAAVQPVGMAFAGWYDNAEYTGEPIDLASATMPANNLTLYAKYEKIEKTVYVHSTIDGSDEPQTFTLEYGTPVSTKREDIDALQKDVTMPEGAEWYGWYTHQTMEGSENAYIPVPFNFGQQITEDIHLYPYYGYGKENLCSVTYDANGGTGTAPTDELQYFIGSGAVILGGDALSKENQVFLGWNTEADGTGTTYLPGALAEISGNLTLYAVWGDAPGSVTLTYHENLTGGEDEPTHLVEGILENDMHQVLENMFDDDTDSESDGYRGYAFVGWNTEADGTGETFLPGASVHVTSEGSNELYAMWERIYGDIKITKDVEGDYDADQTFVFEVLDADGKLVTQVVIKGEGSATVKHLPLGSYTVREMDAWSWRFSKTPKNDIGVLIRTQLKTDQTYFNGIGNEATYTVATPEAKFTNENDGSAWLDGSGYSKNDFE